MADAARSTVRSGAAAVESDGEARRVLGQAALLFLAYAIVQVIVNGIVLDETVIAAQIIAGAVRHDAGHPHAIYYTQAFSLPHYLSALALSVYPSVEGISAVRNVLVMFVTVWSTFALAWVLTRRTAWAYLAAGLLIAEANLRLAGLYPMANFPAIYSNGNFGLYYSVLIAALLLGGMYRSSALLLGLLPSIHAMFAIILWPWALLLLLRRGVLRDRALLSRILFWGGIGIAVCAGLWILIRMTADFRPPVPPYDVTGNGTVIREQFRIWTDSHRRPIPVRGISYLGNAVAYFVLGALLWLRAREPTRPAAVDTVANDGVPTIWQVRWILVLGAICWVYVFGSWLVMTATGTMPDWLFVTMPSRFSNIPAALAPALTAVVLGSAIGALDERPRRAVLVALVAFLFGAAILDSNMLAAATREFVERNALFMLWGVLLGCELMVKGRSRTGPVLCAAILAGTMLSYFAFTRVGVYLLVMMLGTAALIVVASRLPARLIPVTDRGVTRWLLAPVLIVLFVAAMPDRVEDPIQRGFVHWSRQSEDTRRMRDWFHANARPHDAVLTIFIPNSELQLKTGQPLLFEQKTLWIMSYMPALAPVIGMMAKDLYGVDYADPAWLAEACDGGRVSIYCLVWNEVWETRSPEEWARLGDKYRFRFVLSATRVALHLPVAVPGEEWTLYEIGHGSIDDTASQ